MKAFKYDFVQIDLAIDNRDSQDRIIPLAADLGMAVLVNSPFGRNRVFQKTTGKSLPDWAKEIRHRELGAVRAQVHRVESAGDGRDSGRRHDAVFDRRHGCRARTFTR